MDKNYQRVWKGVTKTNDENKAVRALSGILVDKEGRNFILRLKCNDAGLCIEILDRGITKHNLGIAEKQNFFITLRRLAALHARLPDSMIITKKIQVRDEVLASGGFSDVRSGTLAGCRVAVRTLRVATQDDVQKIRNQWCKEVILWSTLSHPNVLKLAGIRGNMEKAQFITVSEWMVHGNIMEYTKINPVNRLELLHGAAQGLEYLHGARLIHGDLKGANILMSNDRPPRACLADFGFMTMVLDPDHPMSCSVQLDGGTLTFLPPEILAPQKFGLVNPKPTTQADIYAFGLVTFQVLTGEIPFRGLGPTGSIFAVVEGLRPEKPENASDIGFSDPLWDHVQRCWDGDMNSRPQVAEVVTHLGKAAVDWDGVMPPSKNKDISSDSQDEISETMKHCGIFRGSPSGSPKALTDSQTIFSRPSTPSTQRTELPQEGVPEATFPHLNQKYKPPPTHLPQKKSTAFMYLKLFFLELFQRSPANQ